MHIFGKLEITPSGAVPLRLRNVVKIVRLEEPAPRLQRAALGEAIFQLRGQTAPEVLLDPGRGLLGVARPGGE